MDRLTRDINNKPNTRVIGGVIKLKDMEQPTIYGFYYNPCIHESASALISAHYSKKGAELAMEFHKQEILNEYSEMVKRNPDMFDIKDFGEFEIWTVNEIDILP